MWCFSQGHTFFHIIARTDISRGRLPGCSVQDSCRKPSAERGGHGRQSCSACTQHSVAGSVARNPASHKSLCGAASIYNKYHSKSRNRIPLCASRHHARQLVLNGSNTTVLAALGRQAAQDQHWHIAGCPWPRWASLVPPRDGGGWGSISTPLPSGFGLFTLTSFAASVQCDCRLSLPV